jgi:cyanophycinase-like exopeptidase
LILVGGGEWERTEDIGDRLLGHAAPYLPIAYLPTASGSLTSGEPLLRYYADLGGPRAYTVPILDAGDAREQANCDLLVDAGVIIIGDGDPLVLAQSLRGSPALKAMTKAFARGSLIVGVRRGAVFMGEWVVAEGAPAGGSRGWGAVTRAVIVPSFVGAERESDLQEALRMRPGLVGIGLPERTALALGPEGQVETWGEGEVTVVVAR